jgi:hypothetical protein
LAMNSQRDVFISYAHLDNMPALEGQSGWITDLHQALSVRVSQILGRQLDIWRDPKLNGNDIFPATIEEQLPQTAVLVSVFSPRYVKSEWCTREFVKFCDACSSSGGIAVGQKARIFKIVKTPFGEKNEPEQMKPLLQNLLGYEFFQIDPQSGKFHEVVPEMKQEYWRRLDDLAQDIAALLGRMVEPDPSASAACPAKPVIYVAETSLDVKEQRAAVRRDLERRGYTVLPSRPLPLDADELSQFVADELKRAALSIHMVGSRYGVVPDGSETSVVEMQLSLAEHRGEKGGFVRVVWLPPGLGTPPLATKDERNEKFIARVHSYSGWNADADLLETPLETLKSAIDERLHLLEEAAKKALASQPATAGSAPARIYLICDRTDLEQASALQNFLFDRGFEVTLPLFEGDESDIRSEHEETLNACHGTIIYYGSANELFLRKKLRDVQKFAGGRKQPFRAKAICIAPPITDGKRQFRTHEAMVIQQADGFKPEPWNPFLSDMNGAN